jgi:hypothetical protein
MSTSSPTLPTSFIMACAVDKMTIVKLRFLKAAALEA